MPTIRVATFNASMEAGNYLNRDTAGDIMLSPEILQSVLAAGDHEQVSTVAEIIQRVRPDVLLINEFDYIADPERGVLAFLRNYLHKPQHGAAAIDYPYHFQLPVNTGVASSHDLDNDGEAGKLPGDAWGFGHFPGQYGMLVLSRYPIDDERSRSFRQFRWQDMPGARFPLKPDGSTWYSQEALAEFPLSSKSHWDVVISVEGQDLHLLVSHPTPPVFDGPEDRNGLRNSDEIRFWADYLSPESSAYIYDDANVSGGLASGQRFIVAGDLNASPVEGDARREGLLALLGHSRLNADFTPVSAGGQAHSPDNPEAASHTASWRMRADYVLPSRQGFMILDGGVYWPAVGSPQAELVNSRSSGSDHRLVWLELQLTPVD